MEGEMTMIRKSMAQLDRELREAYAATPVPNRDRVPKPTSQGFLSSVVIAETPPHRNLHTVLSSAPM